MDKLPEDAPKLAQAPLFEGIEFLEQHYRGLAMSVSKDQSEILRWIMKLHNSGQPFEVDATYSKGVFYKKLPQPTHKFDTVPQAEGVVKADARSLPLDDASVGSIVFDPPFKASHSNVKGLIEQRFSAFSSVETLWAFYHDALAEFWRVLRPGGIVVVKCQDVVSSGRNHFSHYEIMKYAEELGFTFVDLFCLIATSVMWSPNMTNQQHARKAHSFVIVLRKPR